MSINCNVWTLHRCGFEKSNCKEMSETIWEIGTVTRNPVILIR